MGSPDRYTRWPVLGACHRAGGRDPQRRLLDRQRAARRGALGNGGIGFGGVLAFIFADLIVLPILDIYRRYYGWRMAGFLLAGFYATMVGAGLIVEFLFDGLGLIPSERKAKVIAGRVTLNYTTILNIVFLALGALLVWRCFQRSGGVRMLRMMNAPMAHEPAHEHGHT